MRAIYENALKDHLVISFFDFFPDNLGIYCIKQVMESFMENIPCLKGQEEDIMKLRAWKDATITFVRV